jgi:hypothetical protein
VCSLRRCRICRQWFLSFTARHALRVLCERPACQKALVATRQAKARRREQEAQRRARVTVKGTARTK